MTAAVPAELTGLWRREALILPDGSRDETTRVYWLQTAHRFADIRVPADRPPAQPGFAGSNDTELAVLARMGGFAGTLEVEGSICRWHRTIDYAPPGGPPDEADCTFEGERLIETGIHAAYREDWCHETPPGAPLAAFTLEKDAALPDRAGMLVLAGDHFIAIEDRPAPLPAAPSVATLVEADLAAGDRAAAIGRLGMRIAYGRVEGWRVALSTFPWLEGGGLFAGADVGFDPAEGTLLVVGPGRSQLWRLAEASAPADAVAALFPAGAR